MVSAFRDMMFSGMDLFSQRIERKKELYEKALNYGTAERNGSNFVKVVDKDLFCQILENFGIVLSNEAAMYELDSIYDVGIHLDSGALLIANKGATLFCHAPRTQKTYITRHIGCCVYFPGLGIEFANVGLVGNVYDGPVVLRSESACTPSFLLDRNVAIAPINGRRFASCPPVSTR